MIYNTGIEIEVKELQKISHENQSFFLPIKDHSVFFVHNVQLCRT